VRDTRLKKEMPFLGRLQFLFQITLSRWKWHTSVETGFRCNQAAIGRNEVLVIDLCRATAVMIGK
jgi:hypothetical protein